MKIIAITMSVYDDTDIFELHDVLVEQFGDTSDICVYESLDVLLAEQCVACSTAGRPFDPDRHDSQNCWATAPDATTKES